MPAEDRTIVHVAQIEISRESGMGRVAWHWRQALEARGFAFHHIGPQETGRVHPAFFPYAAWLRCRRLGLKPAAFLVHEPSGAPFVGGRVPTFVFSHGLERRGWETTLASGAPVRARSRLLFPLWRLRPADVALRRARAVLVLNRDDLAEVQARYGRRREDVFLFRNGVDPLPEMPSRAPEAPPTVLFLGSWLARKGTATLAAAAALLHRRGIAARFLLAGTGIG
ncbi:MAG: group 1 glycosyl transferase, partial [Thermoanaerobaculia bacterium]